MSKKKCGICDNNSKFHPEHAKECVEYNHCMFWSCSLSVDEDEPLEVNDEMECPWAKGVKDLEGEFPKKVKEPNAFKPREDSRNDRD